MSGQLQLLDLDLASPSEISNVRHTTPQLWHLLTSPLRLIKRPIRRLKNLRIGLPIFRRLRRLAVDLCLMLDIRLMLRMRLLFPEFVA
jgi:hypothetical protein